MEQNELVSVVMPSYNSRCYICDAIRSVQKQTYKNWELIIVDDASQDGTVELLQQIAMENDQIHVIFLSENKGSAHARNIALQNAHGRYIAFIDSDDLWLPGKLEAQICFMMEHDCAFSCTGYQRMDFKGRYLCPDIPPQQTDYGHMLYRAVSIGMLTVMLDRMKFNQNEIPEIPDLRKRNDLALWLKILKVVPYCMGMREVLAIYRIRRESLSFFKGSLLKYHWRLYRKEERMSFPRAIIAMICWVVVKGRKRLPEMAVLFYRYGKDRNYFYRTSL